MSTTSVKGASGKTLCQGSDKPLAVLNTLMSSAWTNFSGELVCEIPKNSYLFHLGNREQPVAADWLKSYPVSKAYWGRHCSNKQGIYALREWHSMCQMDTDCAGRFSHERITWLSVSCSLATFLLCLYFHSFMFFFHLNLPWLLSIIFTKNYCFAFI